MKRGIIRIAILLLLGALLNLLVAQRMANPHWPPNYFQHSLVLSTEDAESHWLELLEEHFPEHIDSGVKLQDLATPQRPPYDKADPHGPHYVQPGKEIISLRFKRGSITVQGNQIDNAIWYKVGLPLRCVSGSGLNIGWGIRSFDHTRHLVDIDNYTYIWRGARLTLPLRPHWPGLIVNTLLYAVLVDLVMKALGRVRGFWRREKLRCPRCGYDLHPFMDQDSLTCPECGTHTQRATFDAPHIFVRPWMLLVLLIPGLWLLGWLVDLHMPPKGFISGPPEYWMFHPWFMLAGMVVILVLTRATWKSYSGRPKRRRFIYSLTLGLSLGLICYASVINLLDFA